ncbi:MAG: ArnT family glycosyltransferase [Candidatus Sumerlaeaceae bacterium]
MSKKTFAHACVLAAIGTGVVIQLVAALHGKINLDEFQFISNGWNVFRGLEPYHDFWDNHGPAANYLFALPFYFWPAVHEIVICFRLWIFATVLLTSAGTAWLARLAFPSIRLSGRMAVALLLAAPMFIAKSREVRGDVFVTLLWVWSIALEFYGLRTNRRWAFFSAGVICGAALWFTPKGLFLVAGGSLLLVAESISRHKARWEAMVGYATGVALSAVALWLWLRGRGMWDEFHKLVLVESVERKHTLSLSPLLGAVREHPFWMGLTFGIILKAISASVRRKSCVAGIAWLWPVIALLLVYYFVMLPSRHRQSLLPLHPLVAVAGVGFLRDCLRYLSGRTRRGLPDRHVLLAVFFLALIFATVASAGKNPDVRGYLPQQLATANRWSLAVPPGEQVLRGEGPPLFRPSPLHAYVLVNFLRDKYAHGLAPYDIVETLRTHSLRFVAVDSRIRNLPLRDLDFLRRNYIAVAGTQAGRKRVILAAGKVLRAANGRTTFSIAIARPYWIAQERPCAAQVRIDGLDVRDGGFLEQGTHRIEASDGPTTVVLSSVPPKHIDWHAIQCGLPVALEE